MFIQHLYLSGTKIARYIVYFLFAYLSFLSGQFVSTHRESIAHCPANPAHSVTVHQTRPTEGVGNHPSQCGQAQNKENDDNSVPHLRRILVLLLEAILPKEQIPPPPQKKIINIGTAHITGKKLNEQNNFLMG